MDILAQQITELNNQLSSQLPLETLHAFQKSIQDLVERKIEDKSLAIGKKFPSFSLRNQNNEMISLENLLLQEKLIIVFLRGSWCPYCNLQLKVLLDKVNNIKSSRLIFITPQNINANFEWAKQHHTSNLILFDQDNILAKQIGISFELQEFVQQHYKDLGIDLLQINLSNDYTLPAPAVYILDKKATIIYNFVNANYMERANINELIQHI